MRLQVTYGFPLWCVQYVIYALAEASTSGAFTFEADGSAADVARRPGRADLPRHVWADPVAGADAAPPARLPQRRPVRRSLGPHA